jgi:hypothetical protein
VGEVARDAGGRGDRVEEIVLGRGQPLHPSEEPRSFVAGLFPLRTGSGEIVCFAQVDAKNIASALQPNP